jgi:hypothetical protein
LDPKAAAAPSHHHPPATASPLHRPALWIAAGATVALLVVGGLVGAGLFATSHGDVAAPRPGATMVPAPRRLPRPLALVDLTVGRLTAQLRALGMETLGEPRTQDWDTAKSTTVLVRGPDGTGSVLLMSYLDTSGFVYSVEMLRSKGEVLAARDGIILLVQYGTPAQARALLAKLVSTK